MEATAIPTPKQVVNHPELFASKFLKLLDKHKKLIPFRWNKAQKDVHSKRTGRDLILKARQLGFSSYVQGELFRRAVTKTTTSITLAHDGDTTAKLRMMADRFYEYCKFGSIQPERKYANASLTTYPEFESSCTIATAGNVTTGREIHIQTCTALRLLSGPTLNQSLPVLCKVVIQMSFSNQHPMAHKDISMSYAWKRYQGMEYGRYTSIPGGGMTTINYHCPIR